MKILIRISGRKLYFSQWCRKGYAVFAALGQQVEIAGVSLDICKAALLKSARKGVIINMFTYWMEIKAAMVKLKIKEKIENILFVVRKMCLDMKKYRLNTRVCCRHTLFYF